MEGATKKAIDLPLLDEESFEWMLSAKRRCGNCKHWGNEHETDAKFRSCRGIAHDKEKLVNEDQDEYYAEHESEHHRAQVVFRGNHIAVTQDGSGYYAALKCREDFGCELFERKDMP